MHGLTSHQRAVAHEYCLHGAHLLLAHAHEVHYTQGPERWEGIAHHLRVARGQWPRHSDCSSCVAWLLWNALTHVKGLAFRDVVNGAGWRAGFTGTLGVHGARVREADGLRVGDLALYGSGPPWEHVAMVVGRHAGGWTVFSHGSEPGPFLLDLRYRRDLGELRRYI